MKKNCNIIKDLLPLYIDDVCSIESKEFIENHLNSCQECKKHLEDLNDNINTTDMNEANIFKKFSKIINLKIIMILIIYSCIFLVATILALAFYGNYEFTMSYDKDMDIKIWIQKDSWNFQFSAPLSGRDYTMVVQTKENNELINNIFITRKFTPQDFIESRDLYGSSTATDLDYQKINYNEKMRVYYSTEKFNKIQNASKEELKDIINKSTLIFTNEKKTTTLNCILNNQDYSYTLKYYDVNKQIIESYGDVSMPNELLIEIDSVDSGHYKNLWFPGDKATKIFEKIKKYMNNNGGTCLEKDE